MAGIKRKIAGTPGGPLKDAELIEVLEQKEPWSIYELADGTTLKAKTVVAEIWRLENEFDDEGNPAYIVRATPMVNIVAPDELRRKVN